MVHKNATIETISNEGSLKSRITNKRFFFEICGKFKWCFSDNRYHIGTYNQGVVYQMETIWYSRGAMVDYIM